MWDTKKRENGSLSCSYTEKSEKIGSLFNNSEPPLIFIIDRTCRWMLYMFLFYSILNRFNFLFGYISDIYLLLYSFLYFFPRIHTHNLHAIKDDRSLLEFQSFQIKIVRVIFPNDSHLDIQFFQHNSILVFKTISRFFADSTTKFLASRYTIFAFEY